MIRNMTYYSFVMALTMIGAWVVMQQLWVFPLVFGVFLVLLFIEYGLSKKS